MPLIQVCARKQVNSNWCWATCAQMVLETYGFKEGTSQSAVVGAANSGHVENSQGTVIEVCGVVKKLSGSKVQMDRRERALTVEELRIVIAAGGLVVADIGGHMVLVQGVGDKTTDVFVCDPDSTKSPSAGELRGVRQKYDDIKANWLRSGYVYAYAVGEVSKGSILPAEKTDEKNNN